MEKFSKQREHQVSSIEILIATEEKEGLLVWTDSFGLAIKGGQAVLNWPEGSMVHPIQVGDGTPHQISATLDSQGGNLQVDSGVTIEKSWSGRIESSMSSRRREVWVGGGGP